MLHPEVVKQIGRVFGQAQVDLFATQVSNSAMSPLVLSNSSGSTGAGCHGTDLADTSSVCCSPIALLPGVLARVRRDEVSLLLVAPFWPGRVWFSDLISLLDGSPWEIPVRRDLLSQAGVFTPARRCGSFGCGP